MNFDNFYAQWMVAERHASWTMMAIFYLLIALLLRFLVFGRVLREAKGLDRQLYKTIQESYLRNSVTGWVFFLISFLMFIALWLGENETMIGTLTGNILFCSTIVLFFLSLIQHLAVFAHALLLSVKSDRTHRPEF